MDVETSKQAADRAQAISGRLNIPVIQFADSSFQVEPTDRDLLSKLVELGSIPA